LLTLVAAFSFGAIVTVAWSDHYHVSGNSCSAWHGLVHGNSTNDGSWHARVEQGTCPPTWHQCIATNVNGVYLASDAVNYGTCNAHYNGSRREPYAAANVYYETQIPRHTHYAH
jgi:hypothetical protein